MDPGAPVEPRLPAGWSRHAFGDLFEVIERPVALRDAETYQLVNARRSRGGIVPRERLAGSQIRVRTQFRVEAGDFLISKRQIVHGACGIVPPSLAGAVVSNEYAVLRPKPALTAEYLRYLPELPYFQRTCFHSSVGVDVEKMVFKLEQWFRFQVPLPAPQEQIKIARSISAADEAVDRTEALICQLEVVNKGLVAQLFTRGRPGAHRKFQTSEVGEIPAHWGWMQLREVVSSCDYGISESLSTEPRGVPVLRMGNLVDGELDLSELKYVAQIEDDLLLEPGEILFNRTNSADRVGKVALYRGHPSRLTFASYLLRLRPVPSRVLGAWLAALLNGEGYQQRIRALATPGVSQVNVNREKLLSLEIPVPPVEEQADLLVPIDRARERLAAEGTSLAALRTTKRALLDTLLTGRIRVNGNSLEAA